MSNSYTEKRWLVIPTSITGSINFNQVLETSIDTLRLSIDEQETFVKYYVTVVPEDYTITYIDPETGEEVTETIYAGVYGRPDIYQPEYLEYLHQPMLDLLSTPEWSSPNPPLTGSIE